jgi:signal transduction histidine kinase
MIELGKPRRPAVLYVDDESKALQYFREAFEDEFTIHTASNAEEGYSILLERGEEIGVLMTDQSMPGAPGVDLLEQARRLNPNMIRILVTAYTDYDTAVQAVNDGRIYRYIHKPWDPEEMQATLERAAEFYATLRERDQLLGQKVETLRHIMLADKVAGLGILAEGLNHHLRNALTVIRAFVDLAPFKLGEELQDAPVQDPAFWTDLHRQAQDQIGRIQHVLGRLGEASQARDLPRQDQADPVEVLDETSALYSKSFELKGIRLSHYAHPNVPAMLVHGDRFRQLWRLLLSDQLTHLKEGDEVSIQALPLVDAHGRQAVQFVVEDSGAWATDENVANLFDPFFVRTHQPTELGVNLTACLVIVHQHGGSIQAERREQGGLRITITLPVDSTMAPPDADGFFQRLLDHERRWKECEGA